MSYRKTIVCLANSRKWQGRCIAGMEWDGRKAGAWVRPVTAMEKGALMQQRICGNGRDPQLLDLVEIEFAAPQQHPFQPENHAIDPRSQWKHRGSVSAKDMLPFVEIVKGPLWANVGSSKHGQ